MHQIVKHVVGNILLCICTSKGGIHIRADMNDKIESAMISGDFDCDRTSDADGDGVGVYRGVCMGEGTEEVVGVDDIKGPRVTSGGAQRYGSYSRGVRYMSLVVESQAQRRDRVKKNCDSDGRRERGNPKTRQKATSSSTIYRFSTVTATSTLQRHLEMNGNPFPRSALLDRSHDTGSMRARLH